MCQDENVETHQNQHLVIALDSKGEERIRSLALEAIRRALTMNIDFMELIYA